MSWKKIIFSVDEIASGMGVRLQNECALMWTALGAPKTACILSPKRTQHDVGDIWFISPDMFQISKSVFYGLKDQDCSIPDIQSMSFVLVNGNPADVWQSTNRP